jgi:7-cyano-7-deazaguanine synthase in queuosine biosynthesis
MPDVCFHVTVDAGSKDTKVCYEAKKAENCGCDSCSVAAAVAEFGDEEDREEEKGTGFVPPG